MCQKWSKLKILIFLRNAVDTSNFSQYPDSDSEVVGLKADKDPFLNWGKD